MEGAFITSPDTRRQRDDEVLKFWGFVLDTEKCFKLILGFIEVESDVLAYILSNEYKKMERKRDREGGR